jgi:hypothetical protein
MTAKRHNEVEIHEPNKTAEVETQEPNKTAEVEIHELKETPAKIVVNDYSRSWETQGPVKVAALYHKMRHPVTDVMFQVNQAQEINDLQAPEHKFVRDQLEAGIFKIVE